MDVAGDDGVGVLQQGRDLISEEHLDLAALAADQIGVEVDVVHAGEGVDDVAEFLAELRERQHVGIGVDARLVQPVPVHQMVAHLVGGIAEQQHDLFAAGGHAAQQQGEAVAAEDREGHTHGLAAGLGAHVRSDLSDARVVALGPGHDRLGHGNDVAVAGRDAGFLPGLHDGIRGDPGDVVILTDDGGADAAHDGTDGSHSDTPLPKRRVF